MSKGICKGVMVVLLAASAGSAMAGQAGRGDFVELRQVVNFADLDLSRPAGVASLHERVRIAARQVCPRQSGTLRLQRENCRIEALQRAVAQLPAAVQTYHAQWVAQGSKWRTGVDKPEASRIALVR